MWRWYSWCVWWEFFRQNYLCSLEIFCFFGPATTLSFHQLSWYLFMMSMNLISQLFFSRLLNQVAYWILSTIFIVLCSNKCSVEFFPCNSDWFYLDTLSYTLHPILETKHSIYLFIYLVRRNMKRLDASPAKPALMWMHCFTKYCPL